MVFNEAPLKRRRHRRRSASRRSSPAPRSPRACDRSRAEPRRPGHGRPLGTAARALAATGQAQDGPVAAAQTARPARLTFVACRAAAASSPRSRPSPCSRLGLAWFVMTRGDRGTVELSSDDAPTTGPIGRSQKNSGSPGRSPKARACRRHSKTNSTRSSTARAPRAGCSATRSPCHGPTSSATA